MITNTEIERKFLVNDEFIHLAKDKFEIAQGYLSSNPERTVRIRIAGEKAFITVKGASDVSGMKRYEWEREIKPAEAKELLLLCEKGVIEKTRYIVEQGNFIVEIDVFKGENEGLVLAEIELNSIDQKITLPSWLGKEVTGDNRYYNSYLSKKPYNSWENI